MLSCFHLCTWRSALIVALFLVARRSFIKGIALTGSKAQRQPTIFP